MDQHSHYLQSFPTFLVLSISVNLHLSHQIKLIRGVSAFVICSVIISWKIATSSRLTRGAPRETSTPYYAPACLGIMV